jgi:outer membrane protein
MTRTPPLLRTVALPAAILAAALAGASPGAAAPEPGAAPTLTLAEALAGALDRYPALAAARARVEQADQSLGEARTELGPILAATVLGAHYGEPVPVTPIHGFSPGLLPDFDDTLVQGGLQLDYTLWDSGVRRARVRQADARLASERASLDAGQQAVAARVAGLYTRALARRDTLEAHRARVAAIRAELGRVEQLLRVGKAPEVDRLRAEATLAGAEAETVRAATELDATERDLARLVGVEVERARAERLAAVADPAAPEAARADLESAALAASPEVSAARSALEAAAAAESLARAAYFPKLKGVGLYQQLGASELSFTTEWNLALRLSVLIWDGGATGRRVARAAAALDEARARLAQSELDARQAVDRALAAWTDAEARAAALDRAEARLTEVARIQKLLLEVGSGTQIDYLDAESELASARAARAETRGAALAARVELAHATGELSLDWVLRNLERSR